MFVSDGNSWHSRVSVGALAHSPTFLRGERQGVGRYRLILKRFMNAVEPNPICIHSYKHGFRNIHLFTASKQLQVLTPVWDRKETPE